jgi:hypothetical protein
LNIDELIKTALEKAANSTELSNEQKVEILLKSLTEFLNKQVDSEK